MISLNHQHFKERKITTLIENRTIYASEYSELNIFETLESSKNVRLNFDQTVIACMITGKKNDEFYQ